MAHHVSTNSHDYADDSPCIIIDTALTAKLESHVPGWGHSTPWAFLQRGARDTSTFTVWRTVGVATPVTVAALTLPVTTMSAAVSAGAEHVLVGGPRGDGHWQIARLFGQP